MTACWYVSGERSDLATDQSPQVVALSCIDQSVIDVTRTNPKAGVELALAKCRERVSQDASLSEHSSTAENLLILASLANRMAPYGPSNKTKLNDILAETSLNCANYTLLFGYLFEMSGMPGRLSFLGFHGGAVGNHAQVLYIGDVNYLVDPTVALIAKTTYNDLLSGVPLKGVLILYASGGPLPVSQGGFLSHSVVESLIDGKYRPSDAFYYYTSLSDFSRAQEVFSTLRHPTPGWAVLRREL